MPLAIHFVKPLHNILKNTGTNHSEKGPGNALLQASVKTNNRSDLETQTVLPPIKKVKFEKFHIEE